MGQGLTRLLFSTLRRRIAWAMGLLVAVTLGIFVFDMTQHQLAVAKSKHQLAATALAQSVASSAAIWMVSRDYAGLQEIVTGLGDYPELLHAIVLDDRGLVVAHSDPAKRGLYLHDLPKTAASAVIRADSSLTDVAQPIMLDAHQQGWIRIGLGNRLLVSELNTIQQRGLLYAAAAVLLAILLAELSSRALTRDLASIGRVADAVQSGDTGMRAQLRGNDEVQRLAEAFNTMLDSLERQQRELSQQNNLLNQLLESIPGPVFFKDTEIRYLGCNQHFVQFCGQPKEALLGKTPTAVFPPPVGTRFEQADRELLAHPGQQIYETEIVNASGEPRIGMFHKATFSDAEGQVAGIVGIILDITERKRSEAEVRELNATLEQRVAARTHELAAANASLGSALEKLQRTQDELVRAEKLAALGNLVAGVAHELNTPIGNAVIMASTLVDERQRFSCEMESGLTRSSLSKFVDIVDEAGQIIERNLHRASELINNFKQLAVDQSSYQRRKFDLQEIILEIQQAMTPTLRRSTIQFINDVPAGLRLDSYPGPLGQVLINLINNALIHAFDGRERGQIRLQVTATEPGWITLSVIDDGVGIPLEHQKRIFDPFFTTRLGQGGSGLGLHIVFNLVTDLLGGHIDVHSEPGQGSCFTLHLPTMAPKPQSDAST